MPLTLRLAVVPRVVLILLLLAAMLATVVTGAVVGGRLHLLGAAAVLPATGPAGNGLIAYESGGDIWVVQPNGNEPKRLTSDPGLEHSPAWSADGTRLAYWSQEHAGAPPSVFVMDADGSHPTTIASHAAVSTTGADILPRRDLTGQPYRLDWSPDGVRLAYSLGRGADERVYVASVDGKGPKMVGDPDLTAWHPDWNQDGTMLTFGGSRAGVDTGVYLMEADGTGVRKLSQVKDDDQYAFVQVDWSPDGSSIATQAWNTDDEYWAIWIIAADGSSELDVSKGEAGNGILPRWSQDSQWVAYTGGSKGLRVVSRDGNKTRDLDLAQDRGVAWSPDGTRIAALGLGTMSVLDSDTGEVLATVPAPGPNPGLPTPSWQRTALP